MPAAGPTSGGEQGEQQRGRQYGTRPRFEDGDGDEWRQGQHTGDQELGQIAGDVRVDPFDAVDEGGADGTRADVGVPGRSGAAEPDQQFVTQSDPYGRSGADGDPPLPPGEQRAGRDGRQDGGEQRGQAGEVPAHHRAEDEGEQDGLEEVGAGGRGEQGGREEQRAAGGPGRAQQLRVEHHRVFVS